MDWSKISPLPAPIITTSNDVVFGGHGSYRFDGNTTVPAGIEFWVMAPPAATITVSLGQALLNMDKITKLGIFSKTTNQLSKTTPIIYKAGASVPDYVLSPNDVLYAKANGPHLVDVTVDTKLSALWNSANPFKKANGVIRVFWVACTAVSQAQNQTVFHQ